MTMQQYNYNAALLMAAHALLGTLNLTRKITGTGLGGDRHMSFRAGNGRSAGRAHFMPVVPFLHKVTILSLLEETGAGRATWQPNGQAARGTRELARWGASGHCTLVLSRRTVEERLRQTKSDDRLRRTICPGWDEAQVHRAPDQARLVLAGKDGRRIIDLPRDEDARVILWALNGSSQSIDSQQQSRIEPMLAMGIDLELTINADKILLGHPADSAHRTRHAA